MIAFHGRVTTFQDALLVLEGCRRGLLTMVTRRLSDAERAQIRCGDVFVFDEEVSGIRRWSDGRLWSSSRMRGCFLLYVELANDSGAGGFNPRRVASDASQLMRKKVLSITTIQGQKLRLISYSAAADDSLGDPTLTAPVADPRLANLEVPVGVFLTHINQATAAGLATAQQNHQRQIQGANAAAAAAGGPPNPDEAAGANANAASSSGSGGTRAPPADAHRASGTPTNAVSASRRSRASDSIPYAAHGDDYASDPVRWLPRQASARIPHAGAPPDFAAAVPPHSDPATAADPPPPPPLLHHHRAAADGGYGVSGFGADPYPPHPARRSVLDRSAAQFDARHSPYPYATPPPASARRHAVPDHARHPSSAYPPPPPPPPALPDWIHGQPSNGTRFDLHPSTFDPAGSAARKPYRHHDDVASSDRLFSPPAANDDWRDSLWALSSTHPHPHPLPHPLPPHLSIPRPAAAEHCYPSAPPTQRPHRYATYPPAPAAPTAWHGGESDAVRRSGESSSYSVPPPLPHREYPPHPHSHPHRDYYAPPQPHQQQPAAGYYRASGGGGGDRSRSQSHAPPQGYPSASASAPAPASASAHDFAGLDGASVPPPRPHYYSQQQYQQYVYHGREGEFTRDRDRDRPWPPRAATAGEDEMRYGAVRGFGGHGYEHGSGSGSGSVRRAGPVAATRPVTPCHDGGAGGDPVGGGAEDEQAATTAPSSE
ncbi:Gluconate transport-inducing protein [Blastocladiella emersonii ATCC 22665]|nr:Gluconate transport-inducing protein [Blastocladiella emersonii ATCC 22665]